MDPQILAVWTAFFVASFVHGATGFGAGMTAMAIAPFALHLMDAVAIVAVYVLAVCLVLGFQLRQSLNNPKVRRALPALCIGSVFGVPLGVKLLTATDPRYLKILLGACMLAFVVERLLHEMSKRHGEVTPDSSPDNSPVERIVRRGRSNSYSSENMEKGAAMAQPPAASPAAIAAIGELSQNEAEGHTEGESGEARLLPAGAISSSAAPAPSGTPIKRSNSMPNITTYWGEVLTSPELHAAGSSSLGQNGPSGRSSSRRPRSVMREVADDAVRWTIGVASGLLDGALNEGGPPVIIFVTLQGWPKDDAKATLQFFFLFAQLITVFQLYREGVLQVHHLYYDAVGLPAATLGLLIGVGVYNKLDQVLFTRLVIAAMLATGLAYIVTSVADLNSAPPLSPVPMVAPQVGEPQLNSS